jgi:hypothetical protein
MYHYGAGLQADAAAAMRAEASGSDPDLARLSGRWERGGLDPIEVGLCTLNQVDT